MGATQRTINGFGFDPRAANNTVSFNDGAVGVVATATATSLSVNLSTYPTGGGSLTAVVTTDGVSSGAAVQVARFGPQVNLNTAFLASDATQIITAGVGFDSTTARTTAVTLILGAKGTVSAATTTQLTVTLTTAPTAAGSLTAVVTTDGLNSGAAVQVGTVGLLIIPTFDSSITNDPNAARIENTINTAIAAYESSFAAPVTVNITFEESTSVGLSANQTPWLTFAYSAYYAALSSHATTANEKTALASLPTTSATNPVTDSPDITVSTANALALGLTTTAPASDGTIFLNTTVCNLNRTSTQNPNDYDLLAATSHEIDEVLGFGSSLFGTTAPATIAPDDLYRYDGLGDRSYDPSSTIFSYYSINNDNTDLAEFNQDDTGDFGDWADTSISGLAPEVQDAFGTPGATPELGVELVRLDVLGYQNVATPAPVVTAPASQIVTSGTATPINLGSFTGGNGPWNVDVTWGDGTPDTTFNVGSTGRPPHRFTRLPRGDRHRDGHDHRFHRRRRHRHLHRGW